MMRNIMVGRIETKRGRKIRWISLKYNKERNIEEKKYP